MDKIEWENEMAGRTPLQGEVGRFVWQLWELGYIKDGQPINAEFMNKYHFEILLEDYKNGKSIEEIGKSLKEE